MRERITLTKAGAIMEQKLTSGLTVQAFCVAENINPATYYYWRKHLRSKENPESTNFIPVCIQKPVQLRLVLVIFIGCWTLDIVEQS